MVAAISLRIGAKWLMEVRLGSRDFKGASEAPRQRKGEKKFGVGLRTEFPSRPRQQESRECNGLLLSRMSGDTGFLTIHHLRKAWRL